MSVTKKGAVSPHPFLHYAPRYMFVSDIYPKYTLPANSLYCGKRVCKLTTRPSWKKTQPYQILIWCKSILKKKIFLSRWLTHIFKDTPWVLMVDFLRGVPLLRRMTRTLQEFPCRVYVLLLVSHLPGLKKQIQNTWKFDILTVILQNIWHAWTIEDWNLPMVSCAGLPMT